MTDTVIGHVDHQQLGDGVHRIEFEYTVPSDVDTEVFVRALVKRFEKEFRDTLA